MHATFRSHLNFIILNCTVTRRLVDARVDAALNAAPAADQL